MLLTSCTTGNFDSLVFVESVSDISTSSSHLQGLCAPLILHFLPQQRGKSTCGSALSFHKCGSSSSCLHPARAGVTYNSYNSSGVDKQQRARWGQPQTSAVSCSGVSWMRGCASWALGSQICHLQVPAAQTGSCIAPRGS